MNQPRDDEHNELAISAPGAAPPTAGQPDHAANVLPNGTRLGDFEIAGVLGVGGFGIVYRAHDNFLDRDVALKEYMPSALASRTQERVHVTSERHAEMFQAGLRSFINEARMLAHFDHPALVKVYQFWEANGTAYMVMPYYHGRTLKQVLRERTAPPDETWLRRLLAQLLDALELIHAQRCFHRDIAPDNILMLDDTRPMLLDFGAARRAIEGLTQAFTVILKQGYAPIEQYAEVPGMHQGAWTDLYALASVVHYAIEGRPPPPSVARVVADPYVPLASRYAGRYGAAFLAAIDQALAVKPEQRPQSVAALRALLDDSGATVMWPAVTPASRSAPLPPAAGAPASIAPPVDGLAPPPPRVDAPAPLPPAAPPVMPPRPPADLEALPPLAPAAPMAPATAVPTRSRAPMYAGAGAVALVMAGIGYLLSGHDVPPPAPAVTGPAQPLAASTAPSRAPAALPASHPFEPTAALADIVAGASPGRNVAVQVHTARVRIGQDALRFSVRSSHAGHVYVFMVGSDRNNFWLLFPNAIARDNAIAAGETVELPASASGTGRWRMDAGGPPGTDHLVVMVSDVPRRFDGAGLVQGDVFAEFPIDHAARLQRAHAGKAPLFAGLADCPGAACSQAYGAAAFTITEVE
ncbi:protein kinase [Massilia sp. METH4]|uniref:serine/threonine-protein kinase n=1 Tax=Massilia sp. METH4 TaxID=3123041 RepID=UPI0030CD106B